MTPIVHTVGDSEAATPAGGGGPDPGGAPAFAPGMTVGRYLLREELGRGGLGVVYRAEDRLLARVVALKVLRGDVGPAGLEARQDLLFKEARALAQLQSPHVVAVHDVGTFADQVYLAMAFMAGDTLRKRLAQPPRPPEQQTRLRLLLEAGRGLAAAHRAGIVHRDFKPDNVLLDAEGRAQVSDFGLALRVGDGSRREGTQGYMAPEVASGPVTPAADQYAFAVTAWEALTGERPPQEGAGLAPHLRRALGRALQPRPEDRFPSMEALLHALEDDPARARLARLQWALLAGLGLLAAGVTARVLSAEAPAARRARECREQVAAARATLWSPERQGAVRQAFLAAGEGGQAALDRVGARLGDEVEAWAGLRTQACAEAADGPERKRLEACLEERQRSLASLSDLFAAADVQVVTNAVNTLSLAAVPVATCREGRPLPLRPQATAGAAELGAQLAKARVLWVAGRKALAATTAQQVGDEAERAQALQVAAEARLLEGQVRGDLRQPGAGEVLQAAITAADRVQADEARARAWVALASWYAGRELAPEARVALRSADGVVERLGRPPLLEAEWLMALGQLEATRGDVEEARRAFARALQLRRGALPADHPQVLNALANLATALDAPQRLPLQQQVLVGRRETFGPVHPETALALQNLGGTELELGDASSAQAHLEQAGELYRRLDPSAHAARLGRVEAGLARALELQDQPAGALLHQGLAVEQLRRGGASEPELERALEGQLDLLVKLGRPAAEQRRVREALEGLGGEGR